MLDVVFLKVQRPVLRGHVIYVYREGLFRHAVRTRLLGLVQQQGRNVSQADCLRLHSELWGPALINRDTLFVDCTEVDQLRRSDRLTALGVLAEFLSEPDPPRSVIVFCQPIHRICVEEGSAVTHIDEASATTASLGPMVDYVADQTERALSVVAETRECRNALVNWMHATQPTLYDLYHQLDRIAVLCFEPGSHTFDVSSFRDLVEASGRAPHEMFWFKVVGEFLLGADGAQYWLTVALDAALHRECLPPRVLVQRVRRATLDLIAINADGNGTPGKPQGVGLLRWQQFKALRAISGLKLATWFDQLTAQKAQLEQPGMAGWLALIWA